MDSIAISESGGTTLTPLLILLLTDDSAIKINIKGEKVMRYALRKIMCLCFVCVFTVCCIAPNLTVSAASKTTLTTSTQQVEITSNPVNVRTGAGTSFTKLGSTTKGKKYIYLAQ